MDYQLHYILAHIEFQDHKSFTVSSMYRTCDDLEDILCVFAVNLTAVHICLYDDLELIINADELQALLTIYDWFMENISNPKCDWTVHPGSNIPHIITGTINTTTTATTTIIKKSTIPTDTWDANPK
jgi:hypothetical protein